jgi:hypothetical protein
MSQTYDVEDLGGTTLYNCRRHCGSQSSQYIQRCIQTCMKQQVPKHKHLESLQEVNCIDIDEILKQREEEERRSSW